MNINQTLKRYLKLGKCFDPDYERDNEVLTEFKKENVSLSPDQVNELIELLKNANQMREKFFVADLMYLYNDIDEKLFEPLIDAAIDYKDPSFNRIFLRPCIRNFGVSKVSNKLTEKFLKADIIGRIGIAKLVYWLRPKNNGEADLLEKVIVERADETDNIIELYFYNLSYHDRISSKTEIPKHASGLVSAIRGQEELESILFDQLKWKRPSYNQSEFKAWFQRILEKVKNGS